MAWRGVRLSNYTLAAPILRPIAPSIDAAALVDLTLIVHLAGSHLFASTASISVDLRLENGAPRAAKNPIRKD